MQFVSWAVGLLLMLPVWDLLEMTLQAAALSKTKLHPRQVKLLESLSEYEIVSPTRVNALGEAFPTNMHFKRRRRSINSDTDPWPAAASTSSASSASSQAHYRLSAFGQQFLFNLTAHAGFIAPLFTVTLLGEPGVNQTKFYAEEDTELKHCFYRGHVNTKSEHTAVISLCSGMVSAPFLPSRPPSFSLTTPDLLRCGLNLKRYSPTDSYSALNFCLGASRTRGGLMGSGRGGTRGVREGAGREGACPGPGGRSPSRTRLIKVEALGQPPLSAGGHPVLNRRDSGKSGPPVRFFWGARFPPSSFKGLDTRWRRDGGGGGGGRPGQEGELESQVSLGEEEGTAGSLGRRQLRICWGTLPPDLQAAVYKFVGSRGVRGYYCPLRMGRTDFGMMQGGIVSTSQDSALSDAESFLGGILLSYYTLGEDPLVPFPKPRSDRLQQQQQPDAWSCCDCVWVGGDGSWALKGVVVDVSSLAVIGSSSCFCSPSLNSDAGGSEQLERTMEYGTIHQQPLKGWTSSRSWKPLKQEHKHGGRKNRKKTLTRKWQDRGMLSDDVEILKSSLAAKPFSAHGNKTESTNGRKSHRRTKRFLSYPRFVEVMVVADSRMVAYHGANLQHYVLTLMSIINWILRTHCSAKCGCNAEILRRVEKREDEREKFDPPIVIPPTHRIIKRLAIEFNMPHDDNNKCKEEGVKSPQHVMAPTLNVYTNPWMWSKCSRKYITEFLDTGYGECLLNEPESRTYPLPPQLPGLLYNVNKQCELIFGPGSQVCPYMMQCRRLWCINIDGAHKGCRTQHTPWADGTECEPGKHCKYGFCVLKELEGPRTDGSWGNWSHFGTCSRTCGGGIKTATRECNRPEPRNGGRYCTGRRMKFKSCNTEPCPHQRRDFRDEQCAHFDGKHFNINGLLPNVRWVPKYSGILMKDRCKLFCRVAGNTAYYQLRDRVVDGTPCGQDTNDICVQGLCRQAGCDHVLNSKARRDKCGVCGGDNSSCKTVAGTFNTVHYGYNTVVRIPVGATNIDVRQHSFSGKAEDDNYLALSSSQGEFLLNGDFVVTMSKKEIRIGNAVIEYSGSDNAVERINSTDRIEQEILLQVLSVGNLYNPDVRYTFNIPIEDSPQHFYWNSYGPWQACSRLCQGERKRKPVCTRESDQLTVSDQRCDRIPQPEPVTEPCGTECELRWHIAGKSECSAQCGLGYRTLEIYCAKYNRPEGKTEKVDDSFCSSHPKPSNREKCTGECNTGGWRYTDWTECSKSCDSGTQRRRAICVSPHNDVLDDSKCRHQEKLTIQRCNEFLCPQWKSGDWSECLVTCGKGHKHRQVWCQFGEERLNDRLCDLATKPDSVQTCQQQECASWQVGPWGQCSVTCGQGYQMRAVKCVRGAYLSVVDDSECNAATRPTDTLDCELVPCQPPPAAPEARRSTHVQRTQWRFGSWTPCSATCGKGTRMRYVSCRDDEGSVADEEACSTLPRPSAKEVCAVTPCGQWKALDWSPCSVSCGQGRATRQVVCVNYSNQVVDQSECDLDYIPETEQDCSMSPCPRRSHDRDLPQHPFQNKDYRPRSANPSRTHVLGGNQWRTGPWGACSSTCAGGFQRRVVVCQDENGYAANDCVERLKPDEQRSCESGPCPQWAYGNWGECTKPCGGGTRTRLVACQRPDGERFTDLSCEILDKPPDREQCNTHACPQDARWNSGPWSSCSVSCGRGHKQRNVYCMAKDGNHLESDYCKHLAKPNGQRKCRGGRCPKWKAGAWSQCSVSCGQGVQQRNVDCRTGAHKTRESECNLYTRPVSEQTCLSPACPLYTWRTEEWQSCTKTCGEGSRYRKVVCVDENKVENHSLHCDPSKRPADRESCSLQPCEYIWITGEWSEVSLRGRSQRRLGMGSERPEASGSSLTCLGKATFLPLTGRPAGSLFVPFSFLRKSQDGTKVTGKCGGYCGKCTPSSGTGLEVRVL
ncbi:A disintegrin and metalloproteinase with thrombospondin motifs 9 [Gracilinanus agilis]|uniref:A disintegrin and metalloproteinase with thrombospondin motifs 9 n=1 Tax=Gracilinanus agilis TaxID=191870 RepID=UPI001CFC728E|nr:A disintegrin and metalloproteinase with thrombospondin motifs 9 [Gracilinanus agilis]